MPKLHRIAFILLCLIGTTIIGCDDEDNDDVSQSNTGEINLNFTAVYEDEPLVLLRDYAYTGDDIINFTTSNFFISDVYLTDSNGGTTDLVDVDFINFTEKNVIEELAEEPIVLNIDNVASGDYLSITFSVGVNPTVNQTQPSDYNPDSPLSFSSQYWVAWDSYIFAKFQGNLSDPNIVGDNVPWLFHTGKDEVFRTFTFAINGSLDANSTVDIDIELDHKELFAIDAGFMDIRSKPTNHDPNDIEPFIIITENFETAVTVQ